MAAETAATPARVTAAEIQAALGVTKQALHKRATNGRWPFETDTRDAGGGSRRLYPVATLPAAVRDALASRAITSAATQLALPAPAPKRTELALIVDHAAAHHEAPAHLKEAGTARTIVLGRLQALTQQNLCTTRRACGLLLQSARSGELPHSVVTLLKRARAAQGRSNSDDGLPSLGTLYRWLGKKDAGDSLVPRSSAQPCLRVLGWYAPFFALTDRPQKPTLTWAHEQLLALWRPEWASAAGATAPSYDAAVRAYNKRSKTDQLKGRHTGSALRAKTFFHQRTYEGMAPFTEVHSDGWNTHFTAPHPVTGAFVTYEIWHFHDVATRYVPPMAIALTENTDVILDGLQRCIRVGGVMAIWQTDHTSSVKNTRVMEETSGLADRLGISVVHPETVGNSQANGIAENFNTWLDLQSRELATYQHPNRMDSATFVKLRRVTNAMVKVSHQPADRAALRQKAMRLGKGIVFDSWAEAEAWIHGLEAKWNNHRHSSLPKVRDEASGRLLHMTPQQSLDAAIAAGWEPVGLSEEQLVDQFRPHLKKKVTRGTVTPYGGMRYHDPVLAHHEGEEVLVAVDRDNPEHVWVKDLQGRLIARAGFVAAVGPRTQSMAEHSERKRAEARIRLRENQIAEIQAAIAPAALEMADPTGMLDLSTLVVGAVGAVGLVAEPVLASDPVEDATDPVEIYLRRKMALNRVAAAQAEADGLARIEAAMKKAAEEAAAQADEDGDFEMAAGR